MALAFARLVKEVYPEQLSEEALGIPSTNVQTSGVSNNPSSAFLEATLIPAPPVVNIVIERYAVSNAQELIRQMIQDLSPESLFVDLGDIHNLYAMKISLLGSQLGKEWTEFSEEDIIGIVRTTSVDFEREGRVFTCLLYTSDAADE